MITVWRSLLVLIPILALSAACGGSDDGDTDSPKPGFSSSPSATNADRSGTSAGNAKILEFKDGVFNEGKVHVEMSGDQDLTFDADGAGIASDGFALLQFFHEQSTVILTLQAGSEAEPGALSISTQKLSTAGEWGSDCDVTVDDSPTALKGEFSCKNIDAVDLKSFASYKISVKGNFSVTR